MNLSDSEIEELEAAVRRKYPHASFTGLMEGYRRFVSELDGYPFTIYDYDNDIDGREILGEVLEASRPELQRKVLPELQRLDEIFLAETVEVARPHVEGWHTRLPKRPGEELRGE